MSRHLQNEHQLKTNNEKLRIVLLGKTGVGKSAVGNTILKKNTFSSRLSSCSVTGHCEKVDEKVDEQLVSVIDTPGLFDTEQPETKTVDEMKLCVCLSAPGPHVFLVVLQIGRFTREEQETVKIIQTTFGEGAANYSMVLFTHGDQLEEQSIEDYIGQNKHLRGFVDQCKGGFHVFNNRDKGPTQVTELLKKINKMMERNGRSHYTNELFQEAEREIEKEKMRNLIEELKNMEEDKVRKTGAGNLEPTQTHEGKARENAEKKNAFMTKVGCVIAVGAAAAVVFVRAR